MTQKLTPFKNLERNGKKKHGPFDGCKMPELDHSLLILEKKFNKVKPNLKRIGIQVYLDDKDLKTFMDELDNGGYRYEYEFPEDRLVKIILDRIFH